MRRRRITNYGVEYEVSLDLDMESMDRVIITGVENILDELGQVGEALAKENAPVDTGTLRRSITHEVQGRSGGVEEGEWYVRIGTNIEYAVFQELGTRNHAAHPFLRPILPELENYLKGRK